MVPAENTPNTGADFDRLNKPTVADCAFAYREALLRLKDRMGNDLPHDEIVNECIDLVDESALKLTVVINRALQHDSEYDPAVA